MHKSTLADFLSVLALFERTQQAAYHGDRSLGISARFPVDIQKLIASSVSDYVVINAASQQIATIESSTAPGSIDSQVALILEHRLNYQNIYATIFTSLSDQADTLVARVQIIEVVLFIFTILVILGEVFLVVLPATRALETITDAVAKQEKTGRLL